MYLDSPMPFLKSNPGTSGGGQVTGNSLDNVRPQGHFKENGNLKSKSKQK